MKPISPLCWILSLVVLSCLGGSAFGQAEEEEVIPPLRIESVRVGFASYNPADGQSRSKVGMWTPVYVRLAAGKKGFPEKGNVLPKIQIETTDSEDVGTIYTIDTRALGPKEADTFIGYVRTGNLGSEIKVKVTLEGRVYKEEIASRSSPSLGSLLVLTLGGTVDGLQQAMNALNAPRDGGPADFADFQISKFAAYESNVRQLPDLGFGYDAVDLMILTTGSKNFLKDLKNDAARVRAISQYVRGGGRLVISVAWENQDLVHDLLASEAWEPALPVVPPHDAGPAKGRTYDRLTEVETWAQLGGKEFPPQGPAIFANLDPGDVAPGLWEVQAKAPDGKPMIARMNYGLGHITYLGFPLEEAPFKTWNFRAEFLRVMITRLTPREAGVVLDREFGPGGRGGFGDKFAGDLAGDLQRSMDHFDVQIVPFGLVALFIIVYILIVGPLDYFVLKYVFNRLEWTWFTFPAVVLIVSVAAYYTAYALKGRDQKINQVDLVEFDLRTSLDDKLQTKKTYVKGESFFTILSPRIQAYTIGLKPNPVFLGLEATAKTAAAQPVSWLGRPDEEAWGMGRRGSQGLFRKPYRYAPEAAGLEKVPIAVWTTKSFRASWETMLQTPPFEAELLYHQKAVEGRDVKVSGTLRNNLPVDLMDVWVLFGDRCFQLADPIPAKGKVKIFLEAHESKDLASWAGIGDAAGVGAVPQEGEMIRPAPTQTIKAIMFHDKTRFGTIHNHLLRGLDQSWRVESRIRPFERETSVREVIVYARLKQRHGNAEALSTGAEGPLPTQLWLGELPDTGSARPEMLGNMTHDTYIRIYLPLLPADK